MAVRSWLLVGLCACTAACGGGAAAAEPEPEPARPASYTSGRELLVEFEIDGVVDTARAPLAAASCEAAGATGTGERAFTVPLAGDDLVLRPYEGPGMYEGDVVVGAAESQVVVRADGSGAARLAGDRDVTAQWLCVD